MSQTKVQLIDGFDIDTSVPADSLVIDSSGNVGVGTTSPGAIFQAKVATDKNIAFNLDSNSEARISCFNDAISASSPLGFNGTDLRFQTGNTERGRFDSSGRLLVGTSSARANFYNSTGTTQFQIEGTDFQNSSQSLLCNNTSDTAAPILSFVKSAGASIGSNTVVANNHKLGEINFLGSDGSEFVQAAQINAFVDGTPGSNDMPGRLVFSTTADAASSPTQAMVIKNTQDVLLTTSTDATNITGWYGMQVSSNSGGVSISRNGSNVLAFFHTANASGTSGAPVGTVSITTTATTYATSSDYRLKENVIAITDGITRLKQLKPSRFNFIADPSNTVDGFLAHEAAEVVPECATGEKDAVDDDGNPVYQGIDQSKLVPLLTAALQEAIGEIESLTARVADLETA